MVGGLCPIGLGGNDTSKLSNCADAYFTKVLTVFGRRRRVRWRIHAEKLL